MSVFLTSDTHFRHRNIIHMGRGRPWETIEEHDEALVRNWNSVVGEHDIVIHLGDSVMGPRSESLHVIDELNGHIILIPGNHDYVSAVETPGRREKFRPLYEQHFDAIWPDCVEFCGVVLSHYPPAEIPDHGDVDRFADMRPKMTPDHRLFIHGHTHQAGTHTELTNGALAINVGVDANGWTPVSIENIPELSAKNREFLWAMASEAVSKDDCLAH